MCFHPLSRLCSFSCLPANYVFRSYSWCETGSRSSRTIRSPQRGAHCLVIKGKVKECEVAQSCPTLCDPVDCSLPRSSIHGIFQARVLEWVAISFSRGSSWPRDWTRVSHIVGRRLTVWATREVPDKRQEAGHFNQVKWRGCALLWEHTRGHSYSGVSGRASWRKVYLSWDWTSGS